jgi:molecular chaperone GrpE
MTDQGDVVEISYVPDEEEYDDEVHDEPKPHKTAPKKKSAAAKRVQKKIKELEESVENLTKERDEFKDKYLRSLAEVDNFRKRVQKEKDEFRKYVLGDFLLNLLEVHDNFERALKVKVPANNHGIGSNQNSGGDVKSIISGIEMIYKQLSDLLKKNNVEEIDALGKHFDPNIHQALSKEEREGVAEPVILEVYQKGFLYNGKLLRPTLAKVAMPMEKIPDPPAEKITEISDEESDDGGEE